MHRFSFLPTLLLLLLTFGLLVSCASSDDDSGGSADDDLSPASHTPEKEKAAHGCG